MGKLWLLTLTPKSKPKKIGKITVTPKKKA